MTLICGPRTVRLSLRINMQDDSSDFSPVRPLTLRLQKANIRYNVLLIVRCQYWPTGSYVSHIGIERRCLHDLKVVEFTV